MKALSLRQPWAWAVIHRQKTVENRRWNTHFRGQFLIHAAKGMTVDEFDDATLWMSIRKLIDRDPAPTALVRSGIIGVATLVDVIRAGSFPTQAAIAAQLHGADVRWWMPDQFGFVLRDVRQLPFIACKGALGFFEVPAEVDRVARKALAA